MRALALLLVFASIPAHAHRMGLARLVIDQRDGVTLSLSLNSQAAKHQLRPLPPNGCVSLSGWTPLGDALHLVPLHRIREILAPAAARDAGAAAAAGR